MIILEAHSAIVKTLLERSLDPNDKLSESYECCDFDGVSFLIRLEKPKGAKDENAKYPVRVEMKLPCWEAIKQYGAEERYKELYGKWKVAPTDGRTHAVVVNLWEMSAAEQKATIELIANLKPNMLGAPFLWVAKKVNAKENFAPFEIPYRAHTGESIFLSPAEKGATAIFTIRFNDPGDRIIGNVFFGELSAARTRVRSAPIVAFSDKCPGELEAFHLRPEVKDGSLFAYVSMSLLAASLSERKRQDTSVYVPMFRDYLHYHIKCTKAFLHQKMRNRTALLLKILDEAKPEPKVKVARTVTGKIVNH